MKKKGLLERLAEGVVIGDGGYVVALEKRGYVKAGPYTPEAVIEHPNAVRQLHTEFLRAGADVLQAFTFYSSDDKLKLSSNCNQKNITCSAITEAGCQIAREIAEDCDALVAASISENPAFVQGKGKEYIQSEVKKQLELFVKNKADFVICEFFGRITELEWTIEEAKKLDLPVVASMRIGKLGDDSDVPPGECAIRMAKAGADVVGVNCFFDPYMTIETIKEMKQSLVANDLHPYLIAQPNGFFTTGIGKDGFLGCPEYPYAMEPRQITRIDAHKFARAAYDAGVRYIGGCCGFEAHHIRALSEELSGERGFLPPSSEKHEPWGRALRESVFPGVRARANREHWENLVPSSGRPDPPTYIEPKTT